MTLRWRVMKLNVLAFGLACGLVWGLGVFCLAWWVMAFRVQRSIPSRQTTPCIPTDVPPRRSVGRGTPERLSPQGRTAVGRGFISY